MSHSEYSKELEKMCRTLEAQEIIIAIGRTLKEPYTFIDIERLIAARINAHKEAA